MTVEIRQGDAVSVLATLPAQSVHSCITSPPYFNLRSYNGGAAEIGTEATPADYVAALVAVFRGVRRALRDDGTLWVVLGDSYSTLKVGSTNGSGGSGLHSNVKDPLMRAQGNARLASNRAAMDFRKQRPAGIPAKSLLGMPWRVAFALQEDGWILRQDIVWSKLAGMPESVGDRCTRSHEYIFMLAKGPHYFYDATAIAEPISAAAHGGAVSRGGPKHAPRDATFGRTPHGGPRSTLGLAGRQTHVGARNKRSVWTIGPQPFSAADFGVKDVDHYAAFPEKLVEPMILAGTSEAGCCSACGAPYRRVVERTPWNERQPRRGNARGPNLLPGRHTESGLQRIHNTNGQTSGTQTVTAGWLAGCACEAGPPIGCTTLDPFLGSGTVALVSKRLGRSCVGIELNPAYTEMARRRVESVPYSLFGGAASTGGAAR